MQHYTIGDMSIELGGGETVWPPTVFGLTLAHYLQREVTPEDQIVDVGVGSGLLSVVAMKAGARRAIGLDMNHEALEVARRNAEHNGVRIGVRKSDLFSGMSDDELGYFDLLVSNPPTFPVVPDAQKRDRLSWEAAGANGRLMLDQLIREGGNWLRPGGRMLFIATSTQDWAKTERMLSVYRWKHTVLEERTVPLAEHYRPFFDFWRRQPYQAVLDDNGTFYQRLYFVRATRP